MRCVYKKGMHHRLMRTVVSVSWRAHLKVRKFQLCMPDGDHINVHVMLEVTL